MLCNKLLHCYFLAARNIAHECSNQMSVIISLKGTSFNQYEWRKKLALFPFALSSLTFLFLRSHGDTRIPLLPGEEEIELNDDVYWMHVAGGIRGITIQNTSDGFDLTLPLVSGRTDWDIAGQLIEAGMQTGAVVEIAGERQIAVDSTRLFDIHWASDHLALKAMLEASDRGEITLPIGNLINITIRDLGASSSEFHDFLTARISRYARASIAREAVAAKSDGKQCRVAMVGGPSTLIDAEIPAVLVYDNPEITGNNHPVFDSLPIATSKFCGAMGSRVENLGEWIFVPSFTLSEEPELYAQLEESSNSFDVEEPVSTATLTPDEFALLQRIPILIFLLMVEATGMAVEATVFKEVSERVQKHYTGTSYLLFSIATIQFQQLLDKAPTTGHEKIELMGRAMTALEGYNPEQSEMIRQSLHHLALDLHDRFDPTKSKAKGYALLDSLKTILRVNSITPES